MAARNWLCLCRKDIADEVILPAQVKQVKDGIEGVQDGVHNPRKPVKVTLLHTTHQIVGTCRSREHAVGNNVLGAHQALTLLDSKGKGKLPISIDASQASDQLDSSPDFYTHTDATRQFQQVGHVAGWTLLLAKHAWPSHLWPTRCLGVGGRQEKAG